MKKIFFTLTLACTSIYINAQVRSNSNISQNTVTSSSAFLDASSSTAWNGTNNVGKGLVFPRTDLTTLATLVANPSGIPNAYPNRLDGMIVYNTGTGAPKINAAATPNVTPGFYYYENKTTNLQGGKWVRIGDGSANSSKVILATNGTAVETNTVLGNSTVMAVKNTVAHTGGNSIIIDKPADFNKLYSIKIYKTDGVATTLVGTNLYSYANEGTDKLKLVFGNGIISTSYPSGTYEYVLEYLKS